MKSIPMTIACLGLVATGLWGCAVETNEPGEVEALAEEQNIRSTEADLVTPGEGDTCAVYEATGCYWMENYTGRYCWIPVARSEVQCYRLDSCSGGLGWSGGGCYKWADGSEEPGYPWSM